MYFFQTAGPQGVNDNYTIKSTQAEPRDYLLLIGNNSFE